MNTNRQHLISQAYEAFNSRNIDAVLSLMSTDVHWPNGWEDGYVQGHDEVRDYWTRQWKEVDPIVKPTSFKEKEDGQIEVTVHQVVKDLSGQTLFDGTVLHTYAFDEDEKIKGMEISEA